MNRMFIRTAFFSNGNLLLHYKGIYCHFQFNAALLNKSINHSDHQFLNGSWYIFYCFFVLSEYFSRSSKRSGLRYMLPRLLKLFPHFLFIPPCVFPLSALAFHGTLQITAHAWLNGKYVLYCSRDKTARQKWGMPWLYQTEQQRAQSTRTWHNCILKWQLAEFLLFVMWGIILWWRECDI